MRVTFLGHACLLVEVGGARLLFDPFITPNEQARDIDVESIEADCVLVSHGHQDHLADGADILRRTGALLVANPEIVGWFGRQGLSHAHMLNHGGGHDFDFGRVHFVQAVHSSMLPDGTYGGNPGGFVVEAPEGAFYYSGDTALHLDMKLIGETWDLSWAALCIGDNFTMGPRDAARAAQLVGVDRVLGMHYDTFPPIRIDHDAAREHFAGRNVELILAAVGQTVIL